MNAMSVNRSLEKMYHDLALPITMFSTFVGFSVSILGELDTINSPMASFVYTFAGFMSGMLWPLAMPLLSIGAICNKKVLPSSS